MDEKLRILLCEDDENLGMLLREYLQAKGYSAELCPDGEAGYKAFLKNKYDLCVLDVMMPKKDGFTLAQEIRQANAEIPIIFLTAKTLKEDILEGFKIGADDYITKPFSMLLLGKRINALLRRSCNKTVLNKVQLGEVCIDFSGYTAFDQDGKIDITPKELEILKLLIENKGLVLSRTQILDDVWGNDCAIIDRTIDAYIRNLRKKLKLDCITTIKGIGYKFEMEAL